MSLKNRLLFLFLVIFLPARAQYFTLSKENLAEKLSRMVKDSALLQQIRFSEQGLELFPPAKEKSASRPEITVPWDRLDQYGLVLNTLHPDSAFEWYLHADSADWGREIPNTKEEQLSPSDTNYPLKNLRIALDPGHFAHDFSTAQWERKYMVLKDSVEYALFEAALNAEVALMVKAMLETKGAKVLLSRQPGESVFGKNYEEWYNDLKFPHLRLALEQGFIDSVKYKKCLNYGKKDLMRNFFTAWELHNRADTIFAFHPDITISIHLNVDENNKPDKDGYFSAIDSNYAMVFMPGAYAKGELSSPEDRFLFLRKLLDSRENNEIVVAKSFLEELKNEMSIFPVNPVNSLSYLQHYSILSDEPGIYYRNLALLSGVSGNVLLMEPLLQDHLPETKQLITKDCEFNGISVSCRLKLLAECYVNAIMNVYGQNTD